ncbi:MAG: hypothetical protein ACK4K4_02660 [Caldimicrobium sp.]
MSEERKKLSWREIDKLKDASGLTKLRRKFEKQDKTNHREDKKAKERYIKELEKLFSTKSDGEKEEYLEKIHQAVGKKDFKKLVLEFYQKFGLPDKARDLLLFLDVDEKELILSILEKIKENFSEFTFQERQGLLAKLRSLGMSLKDDFLSFKIERLLKELTP